MPAAPDTVGAYLAALAPRYRLATLRRRLAALARAHRSAGHRLDTGRPAIRGTLRGTARRRGAPQRRSAALATAEVRTMVAACRGDLAGLRDRALLLLGYAAALRRSELAGVEREHLRVTADGPELLLPRSKGDRAGEGARVGVPRGQHAATCPVRAVEAWLRASAIGYGPVFCRVTRWGTVEAGTGLSGEGVRRILPRRAADAGVEGTHAEPVSPHVLRAGFVTQATRAGLPDEAIMAHGRETASARAGRTGGEGGACPLDLHRLVPVPAAVLRLGPGHPEARRWLWTNWGTTWPLRRVAELPLPRAGQPRRPAPGRLRLGSWSADWTPWPALLRLRRDWPGLRFALRPRYDAG